jgi:hypothetical protein
LAIKIQPFGCFSFSFPLHSPVSQALQKGQILKKLLFKLLGLMAFLIWHEGEAFGNRKGFKHY